jgi:thiamine-phosphate pyrophosphorylase
MPAQSITKLILITAPGRVPDEEVLLNHMFASGLQLLHLRKPEYTAEEAQRLLGKIREEYHERIVLPFSLIQSRKPLLPECRKVHFFEHLRQNTKPEYFDALKARGFTLSTSIHQVTAIARLPAAFAYTFFGPVFDSISKPGHTAIDRQQFAGLQQHRDTGIIALGGIDEHNCGAALAYGFDGVAVLGAIWQDEDPLTKFNQLQQCLTNVR